MNVGKQTALRRSWAPVGHTEQLSTGGLSPHSPWVPSLPLVGLLTHLIAAKCIVSVSLTVINLTVCLLFSQGGWLTYCPQRCLSTLCVSLSLLPRSVFDWRLASYCWFLPLQLVFFSLHFLTYLLPTVIPSHILLLEQASLSLHLEGLSFSLVSASVPLCLPI